MLTRRQAQLALASLALPAALARAQERRAIVLGQSVPLTGPAAQLGLQMQLGAKAYFDAVNAAGGVGGMPIVLKTLDDGYEPTRCKANTEKFIQEDVFALFGYVGTPTSLAALPLATQAKLPFIAPFTGAEALRDPFNRLVFHIRGSYYDETELIVKQLTQLDLKRIAVFHQNDAYGQAGLKGVQRALDKRGLQPAAVATVERNSVDVAAAVKALVPAKAEAIVQISAYKSCAAFIREARRAGYGGQFHNVSFVGTQALADELGKEAAGVVISQVMPSPFGTAVGLVNDYQLALHKLDAKAEPNYTSIEGYIAARVIVDGLRRLGGHPTREGLISALETLSGYESRGYRLSFGPAKHVGSSFVELSMLTAEGKILR
ncbi:ABC transporter substrate-binding protein [Roseateles saccharophilus]|uniref:Amino acid/amide ABC transporter substrate-binding protein (HAAT family) n=1 Tax=Roseateles saccharophilus TaxID=304 RepID=A0A4V2VSF3_ROSSA|nr:ABC transporter substrate-binding protein [Roseateles saccharophilus]MDG0834987.1 ABC transporter permease [Roseateles saccharophilus]TCV02160.1 amino acid/amide ABC transporter substrate-binding protein (HAAT family) [Roseateles saccharophilus]